MDCHKKHWGTDFTVQSQNEADENSVKIIKKNHGQTKWEAAQSLPKYATVYSVLVRFSLFLR